MEAGVDSSGNSEREREKDGYQAKFEGSREPHQNDIGDGLHVAIRHAELASDCVADETRELDQHWVVEPKCFAQLGQFPWGRHLANHTDDWVANKVAGLRLFEDDAGKMNLELREVGGEFLVISQFTLYGDARKGKRPSFTDAARPEQAEPLVDYFIEQLRAQGFTVATGVFGAHMEVEIHNDGPVTLMIEREVE